MRSSVVIAGVAITGLSVLAGCGATDVEGSSEYTELSDERDELATERDELAAELDEVRAELDELDDRLAVAEDKRSEAEEQVAAGAVVETDLNDLLVLDIMNRVGLSRDDSECVVEAFAGDDDTRRSYLLLIDPSNADPAAAEAAFGDVSTVLEDCGLDIAQPTDTVPPAEAQAALAAVLGEVAVNGSALPPFLDNGSDDAVGTAAPVVEGADYSGEPVIIDAATDGPTMVIVMAHWCPHCNEEIPKLNQLRDEGRIPEGVNIVGVSSGIAPDRSNFPPATWLETADWTFPVVADGLDDGGSYIASAAYGTAGVPFAILIDGDGDVVARWAGERSVEQIETALTELADS